MGNRRIGRKRMDAMLRKLNATDPNTAGDRAGRRGFEMPAFELMPAKYFGFFDDFLVANGSLADNADGALTDDVGDSGSEVVWRTNVDGSSDTITLDNGFTGGILEILHGTSDNEETHMTALNHGFAFDASDARKIWLECRMKTSDISGTGFFIGLASAAGAEETDGNDLEDSCGFYIVDGATADTGDDLKLLTSVGDSETSTDLNTDVADDTYMTLSWHFDGSSVHGYVNGSLQGSTASNLPTDGTILFPAIHVAAREGAANTVSVDYIRICQER